MRTISKKDRDYILFAADEHARLVQGGNSCLWNDKSPQQERDHVAAVLDQMTAKCCDNGKTSSQGLTLDDFWFLDFVLSERCDLLLEGIGTPWSDAIDGDAKLTTRILTRLRQSVGLSESDYEMGPDRAYVGASTCRAGLVAQPATASMPGYLDICGSERHLAFAPRGEGQPPMVFLVLDNDTDGKRGNAQKLALLTAVILSYEVQNGGDSAPAWMREELTLTERLLTQRQLMVNPRYLDYSRMTESATKMFRQVLHTNRALKVWAALQAGIKEDPSLPEWLQDILE